MKTNIKIISTEGLGLGWFCMEIILNLIGTDNSMVQVEVNTEKLNSHF